MAKEIAEKKAERVANAATTPFAATVTDVVVLGLDRGAPPLFVSQSTIPGQASATALEYLAAFLQRCGTLSVPRVYCFEARNIIRVMATDAAKFYAQLSTTVNVPLGVPYSYWLRSSLDVNLPWADPRDLLVNTALRGEVGLTEICKFLDINSLAVMGGAVNYLASAKLVRAIALAAGFC